MPVYEYQCNACHTQFEAWQRIMDKPLKKCEHCGSSKVERVMSQTSFVLKGSGWYATDYGRKGASAPKSEAKKSEPKADKTGDAKAG